MKLIDADALIEKAKFEAEGMAEQYRDFGVLVEWLVDKLPSAQPEPEIYWGYTPTYERPLADDEIVPRLRDIDALLGGSYAIHRAIEIIEAVAERRTDEPEK